MATVAGQGTSTPLTSSARDAEKPPDALPSQYLSVPPSSSCRSPTPKPSSNSNSTSNKQRQLTLGPRGGVLKLKRASNLFTASGEPSTPALRQVLTSPPALGYGVNENGRLGGLASSGTSVNGKKGSSESNANAKSNLNLGASLRRTLTEVKNSGLALTRSLSTSRRRNININNDNGTTMKRHGRSLSETIRVGANGDGKIDISEPTGLHRSATASLSSDISEASPSTNLRDKATADSSSTMDADGPGRVDADVKVPLLLQEGTPMTKISAKKKKTVIFRIDPDQGYVLWESKKSGIIPIENIKEIRSGADARYYREQFQLSQEYESRWLTLIYIADGRYKTLHAVASTPDVFHLWNRTLRALHAVRQELMSGLGHVEARQSVWEKRYWKGADEQRDDRLCFEEVEKMCRRLNLNYSREDLLRRFEEADSRCRGYLDFEDFRRFVRLLKERPEIGRLYRKILNEEEGKEGREVWVFGTFERFMRVYQRATVTLPELEDTFRKHATPPPSEKEKVSPTPEPEVPPTPPPSAVSPSPAASAAAVQKEDVPGAAASGVAEGSSSLPLPAPAPAPVSVDAGLQDAAPAPPTSPKTKSGDKHTAAHTQHPLHTLTLSLDGFTNFLLSTDNSAFADQNGEVWQDMTRPLPEYYISSSHNTYLVGHQLVGISTIEGYIRALLHSCRSVEIDIYDGEAEPVIYHGKTLTSKVPLRDICQAIAKYAFIASPYPVIISAEVHCSLAQQKLVASIMRSVFGDTLVSAPPDGRPCITELPSPEDLRGRILLKAKNLYVTEGEAMKEKKVTVDTESSESESSSSSASESEGGRERQGRTDVKGELKRSLSKARNVDAVKEIREEIQKPIKEIKEELSKARNLYDRVRRKKSPPPAEGLSSPPGTPTKPITPADTSVSLANPPTLPHSAERAKVKMSFELLALLVYTVGVKCRGFNKKETYAPEHVFSLSERTANKVLKQSMLDLIKHNRTHLVRIYPNGFRLSSSNYEPHRYWAAGAQLVAINWQTFDLGYMINHSMFQRNGRAGYVLKPPALRAPNKDLLMKRTNHVLDLTIISAQQLPRRKDSEGREIIDGSIVDPYVEVSIHVPDWSRSPYTQDNSSATVFPADAPTGSTSQPPSSPSALSRVTTSSSTTSSISLNSATARTTTVRTSMVKNNGFNPIWEERLCLPFDCVGDMLDLIFLRVAIRDERDDASDEPLAVYCVSLGSLQQGYRHLPLHDAQLSQYLFSTLFVHINIRDV